MWPPSSLLEDHDRIVRSFAESRHHKPKLTVVLGNGATRAAATEARLLSQGRSQPQAWSRIVRSVHREVCGGTTGANDLVLAEAIVRQTKGRERLLDRIEQGLRALQPCQLHRELADLQPDCWITTNYDLLIERQLASSGASWGCMVGLVDSDADCPKTALFKLHGSFVPEDAPPGRWIGLAPGAEHIVISEGDYDHRLYQFMCTTNSDTSSGRSLSPWLHRFVDALSSSTVLVLGKGLYWEDLSFNYILKSRERCLRALGEVPAHSAFWIEPNIPPEKLAMMQNMGITPVVPKLPSQPDDIQCYYASLASLRELVGKPPPVGSAPFDAALERLKARQPVVIAAGLVAYNVAGVLDNQDSEGSWTLPSPGRRNIAFHAKRIEEYAGGAALTAIAVFSALAKREIPCAIVSNIGDDHYAAKIEEFCDKWKIDHDGVQRSNGSGTWTSTILVHDVPTPVPGKDGTTSGTRVMPEGRGQRWFLDHAKGDRDWSAQQVEQFALGLDMAAVLYIDKWFAKRLSDGSFETRPKAMDVLRATVERRPSLDVVYETGGKGTSTGELELELGTVVNIMTAGCPFFCTKVIIDEDDPFERVVSFADEVSYVQRMLRRRFNLRDGSPIPDWCKTPPGWQERAEKYVRSGATRRWLVATLHNLGAIALDVDNECMRYLPLGKKFGVQNTAGAGDTFRGAFCYALTKIRREPAIAAALSKDDLARCTRFSIDMASHRCSFLTMTEALDNFKKEGQDAWDAVVDDFPDRPPST